MIKYAQAQRPKAVRERAEKMETQPDIVINIIIRSDGHKCYRSLQPLSSFFLQITQLLVNGPAAVPRCRELAQPWPQHDMISR